jgi:DNA mismatch repair protein MLH3
MPVSDYSLDLPYKLSKSDLKNAQVLGQVDKKYIVIKLNGTLVIIDQHAADERVKLEQMIKPSSLNPTTLEPSICIELESSFEYQLVTETLSYFKLWGIHIVAPPETSHFFTSKNHPNRVYVTQLPLLILDRCLVNHTLLKDLIRDYTYWVKEQNQETSLNKTCPKGIMEILKSRACRSTFFTL